MTSAGSEAWLSAISHQPSAISYSHQPSAISHQPSAISYSHQPSAISYQPSAISHQPSAISYQPSAISYQPSAISYQLSAISLHPRASIHVCSRAMRDFRRLKVWERSHRLTLAVYRSTAEFPRDELYGLTSQLRRSASSVPANIAEGCGRDSDSEFSRFLQIAMGSASELEYHLLLAHDLKLLSDNDQSSLSADLVEIKRMLATLIRTIRPAPPRNLELIADS